MKKTVEEPTDFAPGPSIEPAPKLLAWLDEVATATPRRRIRLPVVVAWEDEARLALSSSFVGTEAEGSSADAILLHLDGSGMGIPLVDRLRMLCPKPTRTCTAWLEGYWGPLVGPVLPPPGTKARSHTFAFAVLAVRGPLARETSSPGEIRVLLEQPRAPEVSSKPSIASSQWTVPEALAAAAALARQMTRWHGRHRFLAGLRKAVVEEEDGQVQLVHSHGVEGWQPDPGCNPAERKCPSVPRWGASGGIYLRFRAHHGLHMAGSFHSFNLGPVRLEVTVHSTDPHLERTVLEEIGAAVRSAKPQ